MSPEERKILEADALCGLLKFIGMRRRKHFVGEKVKKSQLQQNVLKRVYDITNFPSTETRNELALLLGIPQRSIQVWFQNRRQITRKSKDKPILINEYNKFAAERDDKDDEEVFDVPTYVLVDIILSCKK